MLNGTAFPFQKQKGKGSHITTDDCFLRSTSHHYGQQERHRTHDTAAKLTLEEKKSITNIN